MKKKVWFLLLLVLTACSELVDLTVNEDGPEFTLTVSESSGSPKLEWPASGLSVTVPPDTKSDWEMLYGYYVMRSLKNPYEGYQPVARLINANTVNRDWIGREWTSSENYKEIRYNFNPTNAYIPLNTVWVDTVTNRPVFYRVVVFVLEKDSSPYFYLDEEGELQSPGNDISYETGSDSVSGWAGLE